MMGDLYNCLIKSNLHDTLVCKMKSLEMDANLQNLFS